MGQLEELKSFIYERLHAVTAEILGAIEKAITDCQDQAPGLEEENGRGPLFGRIVKSPIPQTEGRCVCPVGILIVCHNNLYYTNRLFAVIFVTFIEIAPNASGSCHPFCACAGVEASTCTSAAHPLIPSHPNPLYESQETTGDSNGEFLNSVKKIKIQTCPIADNKLNFLLFPRFTVFIHILQQFSEICNQCS